jgi:hypothetical protein
MFSQSQDSFLSEHAYCGATDLDHDERLNRMMQLLDNINRYYKQNGEGIFRFLSDEKTLI